MSALVPDDTAAPHDDGSDDEVLLADEAVDVVQRWLLAADRVTTRADRATGDRLHDLVDDEDGVGFTMAFVDRVIRPDDDAVAAAHLAGLAGRGATLPRFLGPVDRLLLRAGAALAPRLPRVVMPLARRRMRQLVGHLVVDAPGIGASSDAGAGAAARSAGLDRHLGRRRDEGFDLNVNLLGEAVLGEAEAERRLRATCELLAQESVDYVSVKISGIASQLRPWAWDEDLDRICDRLRTVLRAAGERPDGGRTFVNLDMEEYHDLELTTAAFRRVLDEDEFLTTEAGIVLQAYLPDAFDVLTDLVGWARARRDRGGAGIKVRLVKGANLAMERVDAAVHGWEQAPHATKADTDASYKRCLDWLLTPERTAAVRVGVGSHNLFDVAWALLLADRRGVGDRVGIEMLEGMAPALARTIRDERDGLLLYTPVVDPADFDVAISYLFRRLEENAQAGNFLRALGDLSPGSPAFVAQATAFREAVARRWSVPTGTRRTVDRSRPVEPWGDAPFRNDPESDPALPGTRAWARAALARRPDPVATPVTTTTAGVDGALTRARAAQHEWVRRSPGERRRVLRAVADELSRRRGDLLTAMVHEAGKTVDQADPELCEAIDFARYYADRIPELVAEHARFEPFGVVGVVPPWNFPVAIPTGGMMAGLAAGSAVVCKPAPEVPRCSEVVVEAAHAAGVPEDLLQLLRVPEDEVGRHLVTSVDAVILTGASETADLFRSWKPDLRLLAETSGKNALVVTPSADLDLAVKDLVASAFGHAGQKCSAASLAICVGDVADDERFRRQLVDAVASLDVGPADRPTTTVGPLIGPPNERLARALTTLEPGETWLVEPEPVDADDPALDGRLWRPGVRDHVAPGSWFCRTECFGPVLGIVRVATLEEAIAVQNSSAFGLTGGIHSLDPDEVDVWVEAVEVGNAYVNRQITGAIVQRQPFGGWKASNVGPGAKAGGPGYVAQLGTWHPDGELDPGTWEASDRRAWDTWFGVDHDPTGLFCESNVLRHRPLPVLGVRVGAGTDPRAVDRVRHAADTAGVPLRISTEAGGALGPASDDDAFADELAAWAAEGVTRVRVLGPVPDRWREVAAAHGVHLADDPVTAEGRIELAHLVREQAVSRTLHRFGNLVDARTR